MQFEKEECVHFSEVLGQTQKALLRKDALALKNLSDRTIHSACSFQDEGSTTTAVIIYSLSKIIEREDYKKIKNWDAFVKKFNSVISLAAKAITEQNNEKYDDDLKKARRLLESCAINLKPYIKDVLRKASINKGSKLYEHGISLEKTAKLLGVSQWELAEYVGQKTLHEKVNSSLDVRKRAAMAMEFFR